MGFQQIVHILPAPTEQLRALPALIVCGGIALLGVRRVPAIGAGTEQLHRLSNAAGAFALAAGALAASAAVVGFAPLPPTGTTHRVGLLLGALMVLGPTVALLPRAWARWLLVVLIVLSVPVVVHWGRAGGAWSDSAARLQFLRLIGVNFAGTFALLGALWMLERRGRTVSAAIVMAGLASAAGFPLAFAGMASVGQIAAGLGAGVIGLAGVLALRRTRPSRTPSEGLWGADPGATLGIGAIGVYAASLAALVCQTAGWSGNGVHPWQILGLVAVPWASVACDFVLGQRVRDPWGLLIRVGAGAAVAVGVLVRSIPEDLSGY